MKAEKTAHITRPPLSMPSFIPNPSSLPPMPSVLFYIFSAVTLIFGVMVVACRNPVASALALVVSFVGLAALFIGLDAYFIGIVQILVYAGAVMVLFLFIIMLLDIRAEEHRQPNAPAIVGGIALAVIFSGQVGYVVSRHDFGNQTTKDAPIRFEQASRSQALETIRTDLRNSVLPDTKLVGQTLFQRYGFQIQLVGALLLAGTVGVVTLSKREAK
jgi:NADH-quinone oxidoreductase subunit J